MAKTFKRIFVGVFSAIAFMVAGLFFAGCEEDYSNVTVTSDVASLSLEVGATETLNFQINNAPSSFFNNLIFNVDNEGKIEISNKVISGNVISVDITALEGGTVNLMAVTEDDFIYTFVQINIIEHSESMEYNSSFLYYTYTTPFVANDGIFNFDANTTDRDVTFYFLTEDVSDQTFIGFEEIDTSDPENFVMPTSPVLEFNDNSTVPAYAFQTVSVGVVDGEQVIFLDGEALNKSENGEEYVSASDFQFIAIYNHSVISYREGESPYLTSVCDVKILNDLNVEVSGGYVDANRKVEKFESLSSHDITLIPNASGDKGSVYILRVVADSESDLLSFNKIEGKNLSVDIVSDKNYGDENDYAGKTVYYLEIVASAFGNYISNFSLQLNYLGADEVLDENINFIGHFNVETQYVAKEVYLNGVLSTAFSSKEDPIIVYNAYTWPEFGWKQLNVEVSSGLDVEAIYDYATINFKGEDLRFRYGLAEIESDRRIYDLSAGFTYKGVDNAVPEAVAEERSFTITLVNTAMKTIDEANSSLVIKVFYEIIKGADQIDKSTEYGSADENQKIYLDYQTHSKENANLTGYLIANSYFESFTTSLVSGDDVIDFVIGDSYAEEAVQTTQEGDYNLCFSLHAKAIGEGTYQVTLDNGESTTFTVEVINSLRTNPFGIDIVSGNYIGYYDWSTSSTEENPVDYNDVLNLEILNPTTLIGNDYVIQYNNITTIQFYGQIDTISINDDMEIVEGENVISVSPAGNNSFNIETLSNGVAQIVFSLKGDAVNDQFNRVNAEDIEETNFTINITSYSLLSEFILTNGGSPAVDNTVYYGASEYIPEEDMQVDFDIQAENRNSFNFYRYYLNESFFFEDVKTENGSIVNDIIVRLLDGINNNQTQSASFSYDNQNASESDLSMSLCQETFHENLTYFYVQSSFPLTTRTLVDITVSDGTGDDRTDQVQLSFNNGFMFYGEDYTREYVYNDNTYTVEVSFSNFYNIENIGTFDLNTLIYEHQDVNSITLTINAYVRQRNYTRMHYEATINAVQYTPVESVVTATDVTELVFTNSTLEHNFVVYVSPNYATNTDLNYTFRAVNSTSRNLIDVDITQVQSGLGTYLIEVSAQDFYNSHSDIVSITDTLAGTLYIYPVEWGNDPSVIEEGNEPIVIDVSYRNGSENNRYILDTPEDVLAINANEVSLSSHYEIRNMIDMSSISASVPIGLLANTAEDGTTTYTLQGFSGSIVGTTNEAEIANVRILSNISQENYGFGATIDQGTGNYYAGLFAKINDGGYLKNLTISGDIRMTANGDYYVGLVTGVNDGTITNVQTNIYASSIGLTQSGSLYFGGVVGQNNGEIYQYFPAYAESDLEFTTHTSENLAGEFAGQTPKNIVYFQGTLEISLNANAGSAILYVGGVAGDNTGTIKKEDDTSLRLYGYTNYSAVTNIQIVEENVDDATIYVGGAVGRLISSRTQDGDGEKYHSERTRVENLLVGGILDSAVTTTVSHYVGGIVGFATIPDATTGQNQNSVYITNCTSRVFVRGETNTGGILGGDDYASYSGRVVNPADVNVNLSEKDTHNTIEAVDDGRTALEASMIIIRGGGAKLNEETNTDKINRIIAIGNNSGRTYSATFNISSYVRRNLYSLNGGAVNPSDTTTTNYYGDYLVIGNDNTYIEQYEFYKADVNLGLEEDSSFKLSLVNDGTGNQTEKNVFLMFYFDAENFVNSLLSGVAQDVVDEMNTFNPNSTLYPFAINTRDAQIISATTDILRVDINGNLTTSGIGTATIRLQSVLNTQNSVEVTLYIVNYFNKDVETSIFYNSNSSSALNITNGSQVNVYGDRNTTLYAVPSYELENYSTINGDEVSVSRDGVMRIGNQDILLARNNSLTVKSTYVGDDLNTAPEYTRCMVNGQSVIYYGRVNNDVIEGVDNYSLESYISMTTSNGQEYTMAIGLQNINIRVAFYETATAIQTKANLVTIQSNDDFSDTLTIESRNNEYAYYEILFTDENGNEEVIQSRLPSAEGFDNDDDYNDFMNNFTSNDLFALNLSRVGSTNNFDFNLAVNKVSSAYLNRNTQNIYGSYRIVFYANELQEGVSCNFDFFLKEAEITNVSIENYSNFNDMAISDESIVPSQYGILEISIDPVDAEFDTFTISNNAINYNEGASEVTFTFVYQSTSSGVVEYVADTNFVAMHGGSLTFSYNNYIEYLTNHGETNNGRVYIQYFLGSQGVEDDMPITFDVDVVYNNDLHFTSSINLITHLANYVHLSFDDRTPSESDTYFVARGLSYGMTLDYYGFSLDEIEITVSNEEVATISGEGRERVLTVTPNQIDYQNQIGYQININVFASRIVDNVTVTYSEDLIVYVMEYVFNYENSPETDYDIVRGEEDGVITTAIGSAYPLELDIWDYMEYDSSNASVVRNAQNFVDRLTESVTFTITDSSVVGRVDVPITSDTTLRSDYYYINGRYFTGIRLYNAEQNIFNFGVSGSYYMHNGIYECGEAPDGSFATGTILEEFAFTVTNQSSEESPIPIEDYDDLMSMQEGQHYILLNDIILPNSENSNQFSPITTQVASFDGNMHVISLAGDYRYDASVTNFGLFGSVGQDTVIRNVIMEISASTNIVMSADNFSIGMIAGSNAGNITNCEVRTLGGGILTVSFSTSTQGSYITGFVASNSGIITNSRSSVDIYATVNISGFVGTNTGTISSSYFMGGSLKNGDNTTTQYTAGFALSNSGNIYTSYVSGEITNSNDAVYYKGADDYIASFNSIAGFVFVNNGNVEDCYSNINLEEAGLYSAGFVMTNSSTGFIGTSISTSKLRNHNTNAYGFARNNLGTISSCLWLSDDDEEINTHISTIENNSTTSVNSLAISEFSTSSPTFEENFRNFVYTQTRGYNAVWFYNNRNSSATFNGEVFNTSTLQLVAPNIVAFSQRELYSAEEVYDEESGVTYVEYVYVNTPESGVSGSVYNPILIQNAEQFETYILNGNNSANYNYNYYRIINNIDYSELDHNSNLYNTRFMGYLEGNFLTISNLHMVSSEALTYAGLFAEVGSSSRSGAIGVLLNFNLQVSEMVFSNAQVVGSVAGRLDAGVIANVNVSGNTSAVTTGKNIVGGVVGLAVGDYNIENIETSMSATATYTVSSGSNVFDNRATTFTQYSFAGALVGVASGDGEVNDISLDAGVAVIGAKAGGLIGLVDADANASNLLVTINQNLLINAFDYGGLVIGESKGSVLNVDVVGLDTYLSIFSTVPYTPTAVGGIAGLVSGGSMENVTMNQSLNLSSSLQVDGIANIGGVVGMVTDNFTLTNANVEAGFIGYHVVGGIIGLAQASNTSLVINNVNFTNGYLSILSSQNSSAYAGGIIGFVNGAINVQISTNISSSVLDDVATKIEDIYALSDYEQKNLLTNRDEIETLKRKTYLSGLSETQIEELRGNIATVEEDLYNSDLTAEQIRDYKKNIRDAEQSLYNSDLLETMSVSEIKTAIETLEAKLADEGLSEDEIAEIKTQIRGYYNAELSDEQIEEYKANISNCENSLYDSSLTEEEIEEYKQNLASLESELYNPDLSIEERENNEEEILNFEARWSVLEDKEFSFAEDYVGIENYTSLSTDLYTNEDGTALNSNYVDEANRIDFTLSITTVVYNSSFNTYIGEVIGRAVSAVVQVYNTVSSMTANVANYDMGIINPETHTDTLTVERGNYTYNMYNYPKTFVDSENPDRIYDLIASTGLGFTDVNSSDGSITRTYDTGGYLKGSFAGSYTTSDTVIDVNGTDVFERTVDNVEYLLPVYSQNISYTYYIEGIEGATRAQHLQVTNYGVCVDREFIGD